MYSVRVCISLYVLYLDYDSRMISIGQLIVVEINSIMPRRSPQLYDTLALIVMQEHQKNIHAITRGCSESLGAFRFFFQN